MSLWTFDTVRSVRVAGVQSDWLTESDRPIFGYWIADTSENFKVTYDSAGHDYVTVELS